MDMAAQYGGCAGSCSWGNMVTPVGGRGGSVAGMWRLGSVAGMWWLSCRNVVAQLRGRGGSWWLCCGDVVAQVRGCGSSIWGMLWLS
jgi:hypothetical protein